MRNAAKPAGNAAWRGYGFAVIRILFGAAWAVDAYFKWNPVFIENFVQYVHGAMEGQPAFVKAWVHFWCTIVGIDPHVFAYITAIGETLVAIGLILGLFSALADLAGALLMLLIWAIAEGFGGPYTAGTLEIGSAVIYVLVCAALWLGHAGSYLSLDAWLASTRRRQSTHALPESVRQ